MKNMQTLIKWIRGVSNRDFDRARLRRAADMAEYHRRKAVEAEDAARWARTQAEHHKRMGAMYQSQIT